MRFQSEILFKTVSVTRSLDTEIRGNCDFLPGRSAYQRAETERAAVRHIAYIDCVCWGFDKAFLAVIHSNATKGTTDTPFGKENKN